MKGKALADGVNVMTLGGFALAQPLYDLLGRNPEFFVFHHAQPIDILLLVLLLSVLLPGLAAGIVLLAPGRRLLVPAALAVLTALTLLPAVGRVRGVPPIAAVGLALLGGVGLSWGRARYRAVRSFLLILAPAFVIFPALFLSGAQIARLLHTTEPAAIDSPDVKCSTPVVMVVFDEFPLISLLDEQRRIDAVRYPHFAALAGDAHWFRQATTVHPWTAQAVPAILTGNLTSPSQLPTFEDHPRSLFTLLGRSHELRVQEYAPLCPPSLNVLRRLPPLRERMGTLLQDLLLVEQHLLLPRPWTRGLPAADADWCHFGQTKDSFTGQPHRFGQFLEQLTRPAERPGLYVLHIGLPHVPYSFLPSGKCYGRDTFPPGLDQEKKWAREDLALHNHQRHLLQVGYVDRLVGALTARLKETGLYDSCLLIVTADHGCSFRPGDCHRSITPTNFADILRVPLFIKTPLQKRGRVSDRNVQSVDILPTAAGVLRIPLPWPMAGRSALDPAESECPNKRAIQEGETLEYGPTLGGDFGSLDRQLALFGSGSWQRLFRHGPEKLPIGSASQAIRGQIDDADKFRNVDPDAAFIPSRIQGSARLMAGAARVAALAVAVNGTVQAGARIRVEEGTDTTWAMMVPEESLRTGANTVALYEVVSDGEREELRLAARTDEATDMDGYRFSGDRLIGPNGREWSIRKHNLEGCLDVFDSDSECVTFAGWAADPKRKALPERIVMLADGESFHSGPPNAQRPDVAAALKDPLFEKAGFNFTFPRQAFNDREGCRFRFFALSADGRASELRCPDWYNRRDQRPFRP